MDIIAEAGGYLNVVDQSQGSAPTFSELCANLEALADERKRPADRPTVQEKWPQQKFVEFNQKLL